MKAFFIKFKIYFILVAFVTVIITTWSVRGWYEDGKVVTALKQQKKEFEKQQSIDAALLTKALEKEQELRLNYDKLIQDAGKVKLCANGGNDFLRLFNRGAITANNKK